MHDPLLDLAAVTWSPQKEVVKTFYAQVWNNSDTSLVPDLFHPNFTFRGTLGSTVVGYEEFIRYMKFVTDALDGYTTEILAMAEEGNQVFAKMRFHGIHRGELLGVQPTGRHVWWYGMPVFTFEGGLICDLWVLGDVHGLIARLNGKQ